MLFTTLLPVLLPLALARPHHPDSIAHRRQAAAARIVERAGAAYDNETQAEISAYNHDHEASSTVLVASSAVESSSAVQAVGSALTAVNAPSSAVPTSAQSSAVVVCPLPLLNLLKLLTDRSSHPLPPLPLVPFKKQSPRKKLNHPPLPKQKS
jgi:hypothetical protein